MLDKVSPTNSYRRKLEEEFRISPTIRESSLPHNHLKLIWISPVRDSVRVDYNRKKCQNRVGALGSERYIPTRVRD